MGALQFVYDIGVFLVRVLGVYCIFLWRCFVPRTRKTVVDEVVVITGAGGGLGREVALHLARLGAKLALLDIDKKGLDALADEINRNGGSAHAYMCDVTDDVKVSEVAQKIVGEIGDADILINNAGIATGKNILSLSNKEIQRTYDINIVAYLRMIRLFLPKMVENNRRHIVNVASVAGYTGIAGLTDYSGSKFAVRGVTMALREELRSVYGKDVKLTCVSPSFTATKIVPIECMKPGRLWDVFSKDYVGEQIVDGILREEEDVFIPKMFRPVAALVGCTPQGVYSALVDFCDFGLKPETKPTH